MTVSLNPATVGGRKVLTRAQLLAQLAYLEAKIDALSGSVNFDPESRTFETATALAAAADIPISVNIVTTKSWLTEDDKGGASYERGTAGDHDLPGAGGVYWKLLPDDRGYNLNAAGWHVASDANKATIIQRLATRAGIGGRIYIPAGTYNWECVNSDYNNGVTNNTGVTLQGYQDLTIDLIGVVLTQAVSYGGGGKTAAHIVFADCVNCQVLGGTVRGIWNMVGEFETACILGVRGASVGCKGIGGHGVGGRGIYYAGSTDFTAGTAKPTGCIFEGYGETMHKPVTFTHCGEGNVVRLRFKDCLRAIYVTGTKGLTGTITGDLTHASCIMLNTRDGGANENIHLDVNITRAFTGVDIAVSDATACLLRNIRISGIIECNSPTSGGGKGFIIGNTMGAVGTVIDHVDLSDLTIIQKRNTRVGEIVPNLAGTIRDILLPQFEMQGNADCILIDNAAGATFQGLSRIGGRWRYTNAAPIGALLLKSTGGQVDSIILKSVRGASNTTGSQDIQITNGGGVEIDGCKMTKAIFVTGSVNIKPDCVNDVLSQGFVFAGAISDLFVCSWLANVNLTSGSATINTLRRAATGQVIRFVGAGGTQTFVDGPNLQLAGNFVMTENDVLTLVCKAGGENSVFAEVSRSVN